jgi:hypothetical protein
MSGQWPPEWDDPDENLPGEADQLGTEAEAGLSEVAAYLASVPAPVMPGAVEARISAALAVESAARSGITAPASGDAKGDGTAKSEGPVQSDGAAGARVLGPAPAQARVRRREVPGRRRERELRKIYEPRRQRDVRTVLGKFVIGPLALCLLVVIIALGLSHAGSSSSSSSAGSVSGVVPAGGTVFGAASGRGTATSAALAPVPASSAPASVASSSAASSSGGTSTGFVVTESGTGYQLATLAKQAQAQVLASEAREPGPTAVPSASSPSSAASASSSAAPSYAPTAQLRACVLKVTGGVLPQLVDRATYQGTPVYVIASSSRVWVVGLGCTATRPQVIASVPLAG